MKNVYTHTYVHGYRWIFESKLKKENCIEIVKGLALGIDRGHGMG